jgi:hypothetical protein
MIRPDYKWNVTVESISVCVGERQNKRPNTDKLKEAVDTVRYLMINEKDYLIRQKYAQAGIMLNTILLR